jgi:RNA polymerase sigma factor (sigma-70 family)
MDAYYADRRPENRDALFAALHQAIPKLADTIARKSAAQGMGAGLGPTAIGDELVNRFWAKRSPTILAEKYDSEKSSFYTWISRVLGNEYVDWWRKNQKRAGEVHPEGARDPGTEEDAPNAPARPTSPETVLSRKQTEERTREALAALPEALAALPEALRQVVVLRAAGLKLEEIAERLGITLPTVRYRLKEAHDKLRQALGDLKPEA